MTTIGKQIKDEKRRIQDEKRRIEEEKRWIEDEKRWIQDEKCRIKDEKRWIKDEKRWIEDEKCRIKDEKRWIEDEKRWIEDEIKCRIKDEKRRAPMKELSNTADIYYQSCSEKVRKAAEKFFVDIDQDNDGKVKLHEFLEFMQQEGHANMRSKLFETLDTKRRGNLQFPEVLALFYIIQSGRPFCRGCDVFIPDMYFTCSKCYQSDDNDVFILCPWCFRNKLYTHKEPHGHDQFLDNYALVAVERKQRIAHSTKQRQQVQRTSSQVAASTSNATGAIVRHARPHHDCEHKWKFAFRALQLAVNTASVVSYCVANSCTIM